LACLSFPKTLASQGKGQRTFSARSRPRGPFQLFCFAPITSQPHSTPKSPFFKNGYKNAVLATFSANGLYVTCPSTTKLPLGSPQGKLSNYPARQLFSPLRARRIFFDTARISKVKASTPTGYAGRVPALTLPLRAGQAGASTGGSAGEKKFNGKGLFADRRTDDKKLLQMTQDYI